MNRDPLYLEYLCFQLLAIVFGTLAFLHVPIIFLNLHHNVISFRSDYSGKRLAMFIKVVQVMEVIFVLLLAYSLLRIQLLMAAVVTALYGGFILAFFLFGAKKIVKILEDATKDRIVTSDQQEEQFLEFRSVKIRIERTAKLLSMLIIVVGVVLVIGVVYAVGIENLRIGKKMTFSFVV